MRILLLVFIISLTFPSFSQKTDTIFFYFDVNSSSFKNDSLAQRKIDWLNNNDFESVEFFACTDTTGTVKKNKNLADRRLEQTLKRLEINSTDISYNSVGESNSFNTLAANRCVYVVTKAPYPYEKITLKLSFQPGYDILLKSSAPILKELFQYLDTISFSKIELHGHVCCQSNEKLSFMRAKTVENELIQHGIDENKITCLGFSNTQPLVPEDTEENRQINRRVEVIIFQ